MKILHIIESLDYGGAEKVLLDLIVQRPDRSFEHEVICLSQAGLMAAEFLNQKIPLTVLNKKKGFDLFILNRLKKNILKKSPDILHTHLFTGNLWGRIASWQLRLPCVMSVQNYDIWIRGWRAWTESLLVNVPHCTICVSESSRNYRKRFGLKFGKSRIIANTSSREVYSKGKVEMRQRWKIPENACVIGVLARCVKQKNPDLFVKLAQSVLKESPESFFVWIGDGDLKEKMHLGNNHILFVGHHNEPMQALMACDIVLSTSYYEGFSLSLLEAMRSEKVVLATRVPGNEDLLKPIDFQLLYDINNIIAAKEKILGWISQKDKRELKGTALKKIIDRKFSVKAMSQSYHDIYQEVLHS